MFAPPSPSVLSVFCSPRPHLLCYISFVLSHFFASAGVVFTRSIFGGAFVEITAKYSLQKPRQCCCFFLCCFTPAPQQMKMVRSSFQNEATLLFCPYVFRNDAGANLPTSAKGIAANVGWALHVAYELVVATSFHTTFLQNAHSPYVLFKPLILKKIPDNHYLDQNSGIFNLKTAISNHIKANGCNSTRRNDLEGEQLSHWEKQMQAKYWKRLLVDVDRSHKYGPLNGTRPSQ